jgi:hypothetical protein
MPRIWLPHWVRKKHDAAAARALLLEDYRNTFGTEAGQRVLADLLRRHQVMDSTYVAGDPMGTAYSEGKRRVALEIIEMINADPDAHRRLATTGYTEELLGP